MTYYDLVLLYLNIIIIMTSKKLWPLPGTMFSTQIYNSSKSLSGAMMWAPMQEYASLTVLIQTFQAFFDLVDSDHYLEIFLKKKKSTLLLRTTTQRNWVQSAFGFQETPLLTAIESSQVETQNSSSNSEPGAGSLRGEERD